MATLDDAAAADSVLLLDGMGMTVDWMTDALLGISNDMRPGSPAIAARWQAFRVKHVTAGFDRLVEGQYASDEANGIYEGGKFSGGPEMIREIMSGRYAVVVVCDLSYTAAMRWFEREVGPTLQAFVRGGGRAIFPTSEGLQLCKVLARMFELPWTPSSYYRTTWGAKGAISHFPGFAPGRQYSAKACSLKNVAVEDRVMGVTEDSRHESLSMQLSGATSAAPVQASSVAELDDEVDFDVAAATRGYGQGRIAYIGGNFSGPGAGM